MRFRHTAANIVVKDRLAVRVSRHIKGAEISLPFTKEGGITRVIGKDIDAIILIRLRLQEAAYARRFHA